jgi:hypothetical protein
MTLHETHMHFSMSPNIYWREKCFEQKLYRKMEHIFMSSTFFCMSDSFQDNLTKGMLWQISKKALYFWAM